MTRQDQEIELATFRHQALEDAEIAAARLRADPNNGRALAALYHICQDLEVESLAVDAPDCEGSIMAKASLRVASGVFTFGPSKALPCRA